MIRDLGDGLILRRATAADIEDLAAFTADVLRYQDAETPDARTAAWTRDLMDGRHPAVGAEDFLIVEDTRQRRFASCSTLISQTWLYSGVPIRVGQIEMVGTHPEYRGRGLVREQFAVHHERPFDVFAIDGIPWFYRQFGYEMALELRGEISIEATRVERWSGRSHRVTAARNIDLPFIAATCASGTGRSLIASHRDSADWHYELSSRSPSSLNRVVLRIVEAEDGTPLGCLAHLPHVMGNRLVVTAFEVAVGVTLEAIAPVMLGYLKEMGATDAGGEFHRIGVWLGTAHPLYAWLSGFAPRNESAYAWYLRVADLRGFVCNIAAILERRLAASEFATCSGALQLSFYREGLELLFERGRLAQVAEWRQPRGLPGIEKMEPSTAMRAAAYFPDLTFLQLLFGYRSLSELQHAFADCVVRTEQTRRLLDVLFPAQASNVWPVL